MFRDVFIILPMIVSLFWTFLLLISKKQNITKRYLAFFLFLSTVNYFVHALFFKGAYNLFAFWDNVWVFTSLAGYPLYYYYIRLLTKDETINLKMSWILLPAFLLSAFSFVLYYLMTPGELHQYIRGMMYHEEDVVRPFTTLIKLQSLKLVLFKIIFALQVVFTVVWGRKLILEYNHKVTEFYSNTGHKDLTVVSRLLYVFIFASAVSLISCVIGKDYFINQGWLIAAPSLTHSLFLFGIGYVGYYQNFTIVDLNNDLKAASEIDKPQGVYSGLSNNESRQKLLTQLEDLMLDKELFRNPDIRVSDVVALLGSNRTYVSQLINEEKKMNFCEWINSYRVSFAKDVIEDPDKSDFTMMHIAEMSGFSSRSVFYRVFNEKYGMSPGAYKQQSLSLTNQSEK